MSWLRWLGHALRHPGLDDPRRLQPRYFGRRRGSTLYSWMADTHTVFAQTLIPGTQRDSLYTLDGLLANQTLIRPEMVSTDTDLTCAKTY